MSKVTVTGPAISPLFLLFLVFMVLKLLDKIDWSWFWVTSPLWIPFGIWGVCVVFFLISVGIASMFQR